ncbi:MAG TPA: glycosyltransferase family A protein [Spirochaetota bacterium]|nr:glycosyltransferase family A protein [Spirochaetota bacterium]
MAQKKPAVSVIIPFYNRIEWTVQAIDSVRGQTFSNFEIILVDDGSTEPVNLPLRIRKDKRIRYHRLQNGGVSRARNFGMSVSKGELVAFLDSDDMFLPDKLEKQVRFMECDPEIYFSHTSYILMDTTGSYIKTNDSGEFSGMVYPGIINECPIATPTVMMRRKLADEFRFPETIHIGEDNITWIRIARKYHVHGILEPLTKVRKHDNNAAYNTDKLLEGRRNILEAAFSEDGSLNADFKRRSFELIETQVRNADSQNCIHDDEKIENFIYLVRLIVTRRFIKPIVLKGLYPLLNFAYTFYERRIKQ